MHGLKIKICGMRHPENIQEVASLQPDFMGFIFYPQSPRYVGLDFEVPSANNAFLPVGVFVNEKPDFVLEICRKNSITIVQLHGNESVEDCTWLKDNGLLVIKAFAVDRDFDFSRTNNYSSQVNYFLFDTKGKSYGGNGYPFPWIKLKEYEGDTPFFLSGGLTVNNLPEALELGHPQLVGVDLNSGLEIAPGLKSKSLAKLAIEMCRTKNYPI